MTWTAAQRVLLVWLALSALLLAVRAPTLDAPGMYYDEAFLAQQARDFLEPGRAVVHPPGTSAVWIAGRPLATWNAAYLGSLKSQLLIPALAVFGSTPDVVRGATLCTALLAMLFFTLWARALLGTPVALTALALVYFDPSFLFLGAYEWGPFTTLLLCRALGLWLLTDGWQRQSSWRLVAGGLALGLGVYSRADFGVIVACMGLALLAVRGRELLRELRSRKRLTALLGGAFLLGAWPMLVSVMQVLETSASISSRGGLGYKGQVLWSTLDGSHYYRVIREGGLFESLFAASAPTGLLGLATIAAIPTLGWLLFTSRGRRTELAGGSTARPALEFVLIALLLLAPVMWLIPGAVRAHHMLNLMPLPHLLVASVLVTLGSTRAMRIAAGLALVALLASNVRVTLATDQLITATGGRGRFSLALHALADRLDADPQATAVALDWGFHEPLTFLTGRAVSLEPIWTIPRALQAGRPWVHAGLPGHVYLVHDAPYDLFQLGSKFLAVARQQPPARVEIERHDDREGNAAFYSVRFTEAHQLVYTGEFSVHFRLRTARESSCAGTSRMNQKRRGDHHGREDRRDPHC
jgi:hypothetical protein